MQVINRSYVNPNQITIEGYPVKQSDVTISTMTKQERNCNRINCNTRIFEYRETYNFSNIESAVAGLIKQDDKVELREDNGWSDIAQFKSYNPITKELRLVILA